jgi:FlaA1/EpsC-like NDP-sugar epimerase
MKTTEQIIRAGVVGCGYWGPNLIRNLRQAPDCHLKIVCDTSEPRLAHMRRLYPEVSTTRCFEDLLNDSELDAIVVATPVRFHYEMAKAALSVGKQCSLKSPWRGPKPRRGAGQSGRTPGADPDGRPHLPVLAGGAPDEGDH